MNTKALLVGLAEYSNPQNNLPGVNNDMLAINRVMAKFAITDTEVLRNANATDKNIKNGLLRLVQGAQAGDVRIFYISSHGTLLPPGFAGGDDPDGRDEAIVTYEATLSSLILDNWLAEFLRDSVPAGVNFWGIYDCCYSGDLFKAAAVAGLAVEEQPKHLPFDQLIIDRLPEGLKLGETGFSAKALILDGTLHNSFHFGAAEADRTALCKVINAEMRSVFTYALEQTIQVGQTVADFEKAVTAKSATITTAHTPQIACPSQLRNRAVLT